MVTVNDYNQLMKDFPLNDLLAATELDRIRAALQAIFNHLKKIRPTKYPIQRALRLVEAISRDLSTQLLKVSERFCFTEFFVLCICNVHKILVVCLSFNICIICLFRFWELEDSCIFLMMILKRQVIFYLELYSVAIY